jgi:hypothetical protein
MKGFTLVTLLASLSLCQQATIGSAGPKGAREAKWAKGIIDEFFDAVSRGDEAGLGLLSAELAAVLRSDPDGVYSRFFGYDHTFSVLSQEIAPDNSEVIFVLKLRPMEDVFDTALSVTMRVAKEAQGRWSIRFLRTRSIAAKERGRQK